MPRKKVWTVTVWTDGLRRASVVLRHNWAAKIAIKLALLYCVWRGGGEVEVRYQFPEQP